MTVWVGYTNIMSVLPVEGRIALNLNLVLLFFVSIEPYLFYLNITFDLLTHEVFLNLASVLYALDMTGLMLILALFTHELAKEEKQLVPKNLVKRFKRSRDTLYISAGLFAVTTLPIFWTLHLWGQPVRFYLWFIPLIITLALPK
jgi:hypothetical protein